MKEEYKIYLATKAYYKLWTYEMLSYSDDLYNYHGEEKEDILEDIWDYIDLIKENGTIWFKNNFKNYELYLYF